MNKGPVNSDSWCLCNYHQLELYVILWFDISAFRRTASQKSLVLGIIELGDTGMQI